MAIAIKRFRQIVILLTHSLRAARLSGVIDEARARTHAADHRRHAIKFIGDYLSLNFSPRERFESIKYHYEFLKKEARNVRLDNGVVLWSMIDDEGRLHELTMQPSKMAPMEGEAELCFRLDGERLYTLTFSIVDGGRFGYDKTPVIFAGGVQGAYFGRDRIRYSARKNDEIAPPAMLLLAVNALADIWGIVTIVGTSNRAQTASLLTVDGRSSTTDYDAMWAHCGGVEDDRGHFVVPVSDPTAIGNEISGTHRSRTRRRRKRRIEIRKKIFRTGALAFGRDSTCHRFELSGCENSVNSRDIPAAAVSTTARAIAVHINAL